MTTGPTSLRWYTYQHMAPIGRVGSMLRAAWRATASLPPVNSCTSETGAPSATVSNDFTGAGSSHGTALNVTMTSAVAAIEPIAAMTTFPAVVQLSAGAGPFSRCSRSAASVAGGTPGAVIVNGS